MSTARVAIDAARVSPSRALRMAAKSAPLVVVSHRALAELADECGGYEQAARRLTSIATSVGKPIGVNMPTGAGASQTMFVSPKHWTRERLAGWVAGHHEELSEMFGHSTPREDA